MTRKSRKKAVLIIEDEVDLRNFASRTLELEGYQILQAENGDRGIALARENRVDLVLLDLRLPGRDGWSVIAQMKSEPELSTIPVILFTASAGISQRDRGFRAGAADYLVKPLSVASLREAVARILNQRG